MQSRIIAFALLVVAAGPIRAQPGVGLTADPNIPIPLYHPRGDLDSNVEKIVTVKPIVVAALARLGVLPAALESLLCSNAVHQRESHGMLKRIIFYGKLFEGLVCSAIIRKGMNDQQVRSILGRAGGSVGGAGGFTDWYPALGVVVHYPLVHQPGQFWRVESVNWQFRWYTPVVKPVQ